MKTSKTFTPDELLLEGKRYTFRSGSWVDPGGICVPVTRAQEMSMSFFQTYGRMPAMEPVPTPEEVKSAKVAAVRKAIALRKAIKAVGERR